MSGRNTVIRSLHDLGLAAWFGGSLMGAVGLNGATAQAASPQDRLRLSSLGWAKWAPVQLAALLAHGIGGIGLIGANKTRLAAQQESRTNTTWKTIVTVLAGATTAYSGILGRTIKNHQDEPTHGVTEPADGASDLLASTQRQQRVLQWVTPALTLVVIVLAAQQGEQQRPLKGLLQTTIKNFRK
ncbi:hypothetical protein [Cryobacterium sp. PH31-O1]|uniref:hypothetical protein n=1 Tax=Cryobacterium sp. PH31-O1 TaxID=3046306 RepID=UPI0024BA2E69|nr:hypothetical protein [Cryobacterium sp. PH31-O1]MDJ0337915.1 hypothetical protein [Cryobacterium sp. PH31-O1]